MESRQTIRGGPLYWLKRRSRRFWISAIPLVPIFYVASFGPACWLTSRTNVGANFLPTLYLPIIVVWDIDASFRGLPNRPLHEALQWYTSVGADGEWMWFGEGTDSVWIEVRY
jgi:hypothetical protein